MFLALARLACYATDVSCTCSPATQLMFLALAHLSVLRNGCFLHLHTSRCYATDVSCTCTPLLDATQLMFFALAHLSVLRNGATIYYLLSLYYNTSRWKLQVIIFKFVNISYLYFGQPRHCSNWIIPAPLVIPDLGAVLRKVHPRCAEGKFGGKVTSNLHVVRPNPG